MTDDVYNARNQSNPTQASNTQSATTQGNTNSGPQIATQALNKNSVHSRAVLQKVPGPAQNPYKSTGPRSYDA